MDEKLRSSFIPKQPLVGHEATPTRKTRPSNSRGASSFFYVAITIMFLAVLSWGAMFVWQRLVKNSIETKKNTLQAMRDEFKPAEVSKYRRLNDRIKIAVERLESHRVIHPVFVMLGGITLPEVQYTSFTYSSEDIMPEQNWDGFNPDIGYDPYAPVVPIRTDHKIKMSAAADSFETIALQSRLFKDEEYIKSSKFSNFSIDEGTRVITFDIEAVIDPKLISYVDLIARSGQVEVETPPNIDTDEPTTGESTETVTETTEPVVEEDLVDEHNPTE